MTAASSAQAIPVTYEGSLGRGGTATGQVGRASPFGPASAWDFWTFTASVNAELTVSVSRLSPALDPFFGVWFGQESDTSGYFDMVSDSVRTTWFGFGDDELAPAVGPGPGGDALTSFTALGTGTYVVAVGGAFASVGTPAELAYRITVSAVPEPSAGALLAAGLGLVGLFARRRGRTGSR